MGVAMAKLIYAAITSLDGYVEDEEGRFDWSAPDEEVHAFVNDLDRPIGTYLYGRRMWETMRFWESMPDEESVPGDFGRVWRGADKVVYSTTLTHVDTARTRLVRRFDPEAVRALKASASAPLTVGGAELAGHAFRAGLVDRLELLLVPVLVGEGPRALPEGVGAHLTLLEERTFPAGWVHLRYTVGEAR
jgi:dihydrofolate reductase